MKDRKQEFVNAVAERLAAAPESAAKAELAEELGDNLYQRFTEMTAAGMDESAAFAKAMDDLGDTGELVDYLKSLAPDEQLPPPTGHGGARGGAQSGIAGLLGSVNDVVSAAMETAAAALAQAKEAVKEASESGAWRSADGSFEFHVDGYDDDHGAHPRGEDREGGTDGRGFAFGDGENFSAAVSGGTGRGDGAGTAVDPDRPIPADGLRGIDVQTVNGDVTFRARQDDADEITLLGDTGKLEARITDRGVLAIRQGRTAASSFFFQRGLDAADVELCLPRRRFEFLQATTVSGDVEVERGVETDRLSVRTTSGDLKAWPECGALYFKSASGDLAADGVRGSVQADTVSGDVRLRGSIAQAALHSVSGDLELESDTLPAALELDTKSGDCLLRLPDAPEPGFTAEFKTTSGSFRSDFFTGVMAGRRGTFCYGGGGREYRLSTVSGDVRLLRY